MGLVSLILAMAFNSCNTIWSGEEDCPQGLNLRFVYDYNMEYADAFNSQVHCVSVLVFDENGNYVTLDHPDSSLMDVIGSVTCRGRLGEDGSFLLDGRTPVTPGQTIAVHTEQVSFVLTVVQITAAVK